MQRYNKKLYPNKYYGLIFVIYINVFSHNFELLVFGKTLAERENCLYLCGTLHRSNEVLCGVAACEGGETLLSLLRKTIM